MARPTLQRWRFDESEYDRPNQDWVCGRAGEGRPCRAGPDAKGACLATYECIPRRDGAHYRCTRPNSAGGRCPEGPSNEGACAHPVERCRPVRSWKARRRLFSVAAGFLALAAGGAAVLGHNAASHAFVSPGPLSAAHAAAGIGCGDCHGAASRSWLAAALDAGRAAGDSARCVACHAAVSLPDALHAHGAAGASASRGPAELPCATCHPEHRGARAVAAGDDRPCRACHPEASGRFATAHPELTGVGSGVARLSFDHTSKGHRVERCEGCHVLDGQGRRRILPGFDAACARCHMDEIAKPDAVALRDPASLAPEAGADVRAVACRIPTAPGARLPASTGAASLPPEELPPPIPAAAVAARPWLAAPGGLQVQPAAFAPGLPATGEWIADGAALAWRPLVHGDPLLRDYLDLVARHSGRKPRFKDDGGRCTLCHLLAPDGPARIAWTGHRDDSRRTRFSHAAHGEVACSGCHAPQGRTFAPIAKATCAACHAPGKAPVGCLTCHGYHEVAPSVPPPAGAVTAGPAACEGCHANAARAWAASRHARSRLDDADRRGSAAKIAAALSVRDPATDARCTRCHATIAVAEDGAPGAVAGVSCESCHGPARPWIGAHADLARPDRAAAATAAGMVRADDAFGLADACFRCHVVADPALVAAGHLAGSPLDALLWSQGEVRHGFGDGCTGGETPVNRALSGPARRVLFLTGALLDADHSLRALAAAREPGEYADAMRLRVSKAARKLGRAAGAGGEVEARLAPLLADLDALGLDEETARPARPALLEAAARARELARSAGPAAGPAEALDAIAGARVKGAFWAPE